MITIGSVISSLGPGRSGLQAVVRVAILLLVASTSHAETYDPIPTPYCNIVYDGPPSYDQLENKVTSSNPQGKAMAQFVLEAFAQANANNALLDSRSESDVVTALNRLQSIWVPSSLNFKSYYTDSGVTDENTLEFVTESLAQIPYRFPHLLAHYGPVSQSGTIEHLLSTLLSEGRTGEINRHFTIGYTNIWLLRLCNLILTGQGPIDGNGNALLAPTADVTNRGRTDFMTWVSTVRNNGIHEFMSPTYTGVQLEALGYIDLYARDPGIAAMAQQAYKLLWTDLYANWYDRNQRMGGTHSRTYEFLTDQDRETDRFLYSPSHLTNPPSPNWPVLLTTRSNGYWRGQDFIAYVLPPPGDVPYLYGANIATNRSRTILRSFVSDETNYDPNYMFSENYMSNPTGKGGLTYPFSVSSTESFYDDLTFEGLTIMMPGDGSTANVNFNMQGRHDYYLEHKVSGSRKAETLKPFIASVQNAAETLFLASSSGPYDTDATEIASTIVIPNSAQIWINNAPSPLRLDSVRSLSLDPGTALFIQTTNHGQTDALVTGIRFLLSTEMNGSAVGLTLANDGSQYNALRVTCVHAASRPSSGHAVIACWTRTGYCSDTSTNFNAFRSAFTSASVVNSYTPSTGAISLSVPGLHRRMSINANAATETTTSLSGSDLESAFTIPLLSVNGAEYVTETLQDWISQDIGTATSGSAIQRTANGLYSGQIQVIGSGGDIWASADGFQFYYQRLVGNPTIIGQLTSMPTGGGVDQWAKAGLMMRSDLTPGSMNALIGLEGTHGQRFSVRNQANANTARSGNSVTSVPYWFKLTRVNNTFTGYSSRDGVNWTQVGEPTKISMNNTIYVGVAVTSRNRGSLLTTGLDSVGILQQ